MKKYDINTRQGRARRSNDWQNFNHSTGLPHSAKFIALRKELRKSDAEAKAKKWAAILGK